MGKLENDLSEFLELTKFNLTQAEILDIGTYCKFLARNPIVQLSRSSRKGSTASAYVLPNLLYKALITRTIVYQSISLENDDNIMQPQRTNQLANLLERKFKSLQVAPIFKFPSSESQLFQDQAQSQSKIVKKLSNINVNILSDQQILRSKYKGTELSQLYGGFYYKLNWGMQVYVRLTDVLTKQDLIYQPDVQLQLRVYQQARSSDERIVGTHRKLFVGLPSGRSFIISLKDKRDVNRSMRNLLEAEYSNLVQDINQISSLPKINQSNEIGQNLNEIGQNLVVPNLSTTSCNLCGFSHVCHRSRQWFSNQIREV